MYKIVSTINTSDNGEKITFYGIEFKQIKYCDLSTDRKCVKKLCKLLNKYKIQEPQLKDIIEDFLLSNTGLSSIFSR